MEFLITAIVKLPDNATPQEIAKFQRKLTERIKLEETGMFYDDANRNPLVYWSFHQLDCPFPILSGRLP